MSWFGHPNLASLPNNIYLIFCIHWDNRIFHFSQPRDAWKFYEILRYYSIYTLNKKTCLNKQRLYGLFQLGLRTLALGKRVFTPSEYESVDSMLTEARNAMENREDKVPCCYVFTDNGHSLIVLKICQSYS